jgi:glycosyltransferase involved in cell wall biosynthesis
VAERPWLSVLLPTCQGARHLPAALESLRPAAGESLEVLAFDDGSTDGTLALLESWVGRLPLVIRAHPREGNWVRSTNRALAEARGEWITILHQDDVWMPGRYRFLRAGAAACPEAGWIAHAAWFLDESGRRMGRWTCPLPANRPVPPARVLPRLAVQNFLSVPAVCFRRDRALAAGPMDEALWYFADWDYWLRLAALGPVFYGAEPLAGFRIHAESQTATRTRATEEVGAQFDRVLARALGDPAFPPARLAAAHRGARFARYAYLQLLAAAHGGRVNVPGLIAEAVRLGPAGLWRYARDSRIAERAPPRWRLRRAARPEGSRP